MIDALEEIFDIITTADDLYKIPLNTRFWYVGTVYGQPKYIGNDYVVDKGKYIELCPEKDYLPDNLKYGNCFMVETVSTFGDGEKFRSIRYLSDYFFGKGKIVTLSENSAKRAFEILTKAYNNDPVWQIEVAHEKAWLNSLYDF